MVHLWDAWELQGSRERALRGSAGERQGEQVRQGVLSEVFAGAEWAGQRGGQAPCQQTLPVSWHPPDRVWH